MLVNIFFMLGDSRNFWQNIHPCLAQGSAAEVTPGPHHAGDLHQGLPVREEGGTGGSVPAPSSGQEDVGGVVAGHAVEGEWRGEVRTSGPPPPPMSSTGATGGGSSVGLLRSHRPRYQCKFSAFILLLLFICDVRDGRTKFYQLIL